MFDFHHRAFILGAFPDFLRRWRISRGDKIGPRFGPRAWHDDCVDSRPMSRNWLLTRSRPGPVLRIGFSALALTFLLADDGIGPDEFQCEVAVVHLTDCCPGLPSDMLSCTHGGCESNITPDLQAEHALCLQAKSCEELMALGACDLTTWEPLPSPTCAPPCAGKVPPCR